MNREEAIKLLEHISIAYTPTDAYGDYDDPQPYEEAIDMAIEALTTNAVQGEWIRLIEYVPESNESLINFDGYQCSVCGGKLWADSFNFWNFCPNCGARMKGGDDE